MKQTIASQHNITPAQVIPGKAHARSQKWRLVHLFQTLVSHVLIITIGAFFVVPFLWMLLTAFKSDQDVFRSPPRWLPYDNVRVAVSGTHPGLT